MNTEFDPDFEREQAAHDPSTAPMDELERRRGELEQLQAERLLERADLENQRKRLARDVDAARKFANERLLGDLLPVFDSLEAGLATVGDNAQLRAGLELTMKQLQDMAERHGLTPVAPAPGDAFNPDHHQAMSLVDAADVTPGAVAQLFQKGYVLNERLLRPALVMVARQD